MDSRQRIRPSQFVAVDDVLPEGSDADEITFAEFVIVPGSDIDHTTLVYRADGIEGTRGTWGLSMYYPYRYNGPDVAISDRDADRILRNLYDDDLDSVDWESDGGSYFE